MTPICLIPANAFGRMLNLSRPPRTMNLNTSAGNFNRQPHDNLCHPRSGSWQSACERGRSLHSLSLASDGNLLLSEQRGGEVVGSRGGSSGGSRHRQADRAGSSRTHIRRLGRSPAQADETIPSESGWNVCRSRTPSAQVAPGARSSSPHPRFTPASRRTAPLMLQNDSPHQASPNGAAAAETDAQRRREKRLYLAATEFREPRS